MEYLYVRCHPTVLESGRPLGFGELADEHEADQRLIDDGSLVPNPAPVADSTPTSKPKETGADAART